MGVEARAYVTRPESSAVEEISFTDIPPSRKIGVLSRREDLDALDFAGASLGDAGVSDGSERYFLRSFDGRVFELLERGDVDSLTGGDTAFSGDDLRVFERIKSVLEDLRERRVVSGEEMVSVRKLLGLFDCGDWSALEASLSLLDPRSLKDLSRILGVERTRRMQEGDPAGLESILRLGALAFQYTQPWD